MVIFMTMVRTKLKMTTAMRWTTAVMVDMVVTVRGHHPFETLSGPPHVRVRSDRVEDHVVRALYVYLASVAISTMVLVVE